MGNDGKLIDFATFLKTHVKGFDVVRGLGDSGNHLILVRNSESLEIPKLEMIYRMGGRPDTKVFRLPDPSGSPKFAVVADANLRPAVVTLSTLQQRFPNLSEKEMVELVSGRNRTLYDVGWIGTRRRTALQKGEGVIPVESVTKKQNETSATTQKEFEVGPGL